MAGAFRFIGVILVLAGLGLLFANWTMGIGVMAGGAVLLLLTAGRQQRDESPNHPTT